MLGLLIAHLFLQHKTNDNNDPISRWPEGQIITFFLLHPPVFPDKSFIPSRFRKASFQNRDHTCLLQKATPRQIYLQKFPASRYHDFTLNKDDTTIVWSLPSQWLAAYPELLNDIKMGSQNKQLSIHVYTVYPKKYAHGFCFAVLCCGYTLTDFPISIRLTSLALWQSNDCPSASKATLMNMNKYFMWIHYERLHNHNKAKHKKTCAYFLGYTVIDYITIQREQCINTPHVRRSTYHWYIGRLVHISLNWSKVVTMTFLPDAKKGSS